VRAAINAIEDSRFYLSLRSIKQINETDTDRPATQQQFENQDLRARTTTMMVMSQSKVISYMFNVIHTYTSYCTCKLKYVQHNSH
jgi:hypothetical protein